MKGYTLPQEQLDALANYHRDFQTTIAVIANRKCGVEIAEPRFPFIDGGGIVVKGRHIMINKDRVRDDSRLLPHSSREEKATVEAIYEAVALFNEKGGKAFVSFANVKMPAFRIPGDPLRRMFNLKFGNS
jgi:hypothetical protein